MSNQSDSDNVTPALNLCQIYFQITAPTVCTIVLITMIPALYKYIKSDNLENQYLFWGGLIFFITIFLAIIINIFFSIYRCTDSKTISFLPIYLVNYITFKHAYCSGYFSEGYIFYLMEQYLYLH